MTRDSDGPAGASGDGVSPDAFALVGNEIRAEIVRALGDARVETQTTPVLSFAELRARTDADVGSSQFNYHLQQLVGHYLTRTDDGYRMRPEGRMLYQALRAGTFTPRDTVAPVDAGFDCYYCETAVEAVVEAGTVSVRCPGCDFGYGLSAVPPGAVDDGSVALDQVAAYYHHHHLAFARGVCSTCGSATDTEIKPVDGVPFADAERQEVYVYRSCPNCGDQRHLSLGTALLADPALVAFCLDHGVDVLSTPLWELEFAATDRGVTVRSSDPWELALTVTFDDETLELVVDGDLNVVERTRS